MEMRFHKIEENFRLEIHVSGECDMYNANDFFRQMAEQINNGYGYICVDFSGIRYLDSSGIGAMVKVIRYAQEKKTNITFRGISGMPRKVLKMSNILSLIREETL